MSKDQQSSKIKRTNSSGKMGVVVRKIKNQKYSGYHPQAAWKVAYADFVTAMMAFFLLMWLVSVSSDDTLKGVAEYFSPTESSKDNMGIGFDGGTDTAVDKRIGAINRSSASLVIGSPTKGHRIKPNAMNDSISDLEKQHFLNIINSINKSAEIQMYADNLSMSLSDDGLHIEITDSHNRNMFKSNSAELEPYMLKILGVVGKIVKDQPNYIAITGHTAHVPVATNAKNLDFWHISASRANEVRKYLISSLISPNQIAKIVGKADTEPLDAKNPSAPKNIRVSITLLNSQSVSINKKSSPNNM